MSWSLAIDEGVITIIKWEEDIKYLVDRKVNEKKFYSDLLVIAVVDRFLKLSRGFRLLIEEKNIQCAVVIARCQIDSLARFHGMRKMEGNEFEYVFKFLSHAKKFKDNKDTKNKQLTDCYLVESLDITYPGIKKVYEEFCGYAHLSEKHHAACSMRVPCKEDGYVEYNTIMSKYDVYVDEISYSNAIDKCIDIFNMFKNELDYYFAKRHNFPNNNHLFSA